MEVLGNIIYHPIDDEIKTKVNRKTLYVPVFGNIPCGSTNFMDDDLKGYLEIPESMVGQGEYYVLRAKGDSMVDAGIDNGDLVIVKKQNYADDSQIVVAFVNGETTLKRFYRNDEKKLIELKPDNKRYESIFVSDCIILGVAAKVIKDIL